jgi:hypothetical protein
VKNNLTPEEQDRVEEWVEDNLWTQLLLDCFLFIN